MRRANLFTDPKTGATYAWPVNHNEESPIQKSRQMGDGAPTANIGLIPQQGPPTPMRLEWKGRILTKAHYNAMIQWWERCETHSIYITDPAGSTYEILITDFQPQRVAVAQNRFDMANAPTWVWQYTLAMRVLRAISGEWAGVP